MLGEPNQPFSIPAFRVTRTSDQSSLTGNAYNKITWTQADYNTGGAYNMSTLRFQPPVPGIYRVTLSVASNNSGGATCAAGIYVNGSLYAQGNAQDVASSSTWISLVTVDLQMDGKNDYVEGWVFLPTGITVLHGTYTATFMVGAFIRPPG